MDITFKRGRTWQQPFTYKINDVPVPSGGFEIGFHLRSESGSDDFFTLTTNGGASPLGSSIVWTNRAGGEYLLTITDEETMTFSLDSSGNYSFTRQVSGHKFDLGAGYYVVTNPKNG